MPFSKPQVSKLQNAARDGDKGTVIIKNTDPPSIRSPGKEHGKFMGQAEKAGQADIHTNYIGRREALELCNFLFLMSGLAKLDMPASKRGKAKQLKHGLDVNATLAAFAVPLEMLDAEVEDRRRHEAQIIYRQVVDSDDRYEGFLNFLDEEKESIRQGIKEFSPHSPYRENVSLSVFESRS